VKVIVTGGAGVIGSALARAVLSQGTTLVVVSHFDLAGSDLDVPPPAVARVSPIHVEAYWEVEQL
jgi:nucleoside-diphosphate-sugar epimerase